MKIKTLQWQVKEFEEILMREKTRPVVIHPTNLDSNFIGYYMEIYIVYPDCEKSPRFHSARDALKKSQVNNDKYLFIPYQGNCEEGWNVICYANDLKIAIERSQKSFENEVKKFLEND